MSRRALALALAFAASVASAGAPAAPRPLLAWGDDPPATEVRGLAGDRTITVRYGALAPVTFYAELDGDPVTALFHPEAGKDETVELPFIGGRNRLRIGASSPDGLQHVTLEREIAFARLPSDADHAEKLRSAPELEHALWLERTPVAPATPAAPAPASAPPAAAPPTR